ncbi:adenosylmethionine decarboxylase [Polymorphum gilvum]|uniref:S-adenosylmethionine decarboxylase proenzyme n=1 Tax=Polymorphum gilvum (strain LMG 25793 / CGMCC 1.9160 / SL003B-26A1) TaxID=991905 RepID=F2J1B8_POLGS|nr:adenosylmethionine decarboxylase [Polymorphum gilvum]ADZ69700.1 S-adenosylmethionine decarboxylase proenzyme, putative [Polymorphum gilvum SL003B-26A1]
MSHDALFQLGMDLEAHPAPRAERAAGPRSTTQTEDTIVAPVPARDADDRLDHFIEKQGIRCAGAHLIIDLYEAERLDDLPYIEETLKTCVEEAGATLLHIHLHPFEPTGVSGVAVLAESHISVHTWPEAGYAAFDVFMCGDAKPEKCVDVLERAFRPSRTAVSELLRGREVA